MKLFDEPFALIQDGSKVIEVRLCDEKRRKLRVNDIIEFHKMSSETRKLQVKVLGLQKFNSFKEIYESFPKKIVGGTDYTTAELIDASHEIYSEKQESTYGALAIYFEKL